MLGRKLLFLLVCVFLIQQGVCDDDGRQEQCTQKVDCASCIQTLGCCWCSKNIKSDHCLSSLSNMTTLCEDDSICHDPKNERIEGMDVDEKLGVSEEEGVQQIRQIRPQEISLKLRVGDPYKLQVQYQQATDYPVDLYYLMDLSNSMEDDKENLSKLGDKLAIAMKNLTKNFRLGFGSFVDKVAMPFVSTYPEKLKSPCPNCKPPYSFKNHLPLTDNTDEFSKKVDETKVSGNLDSPEGGFDALMQVMVCENEIMWRKDARHLVVFSTDASFHQAGDGKLAGIVLPNDGNCHLEDNEYKKYLDYDYPSISQLNQKAKSNNMNLIFAVTANQEALYGELQKRIAGASSGQLDKNSSNVIKLVLDQYEKLVESVTLDNAPNPFINVRYYTNCLNESGTPEETKTCLGTRVKLTVNYTAEIQVTKCPTNLEDRFQTLIIKPQAVNEDLIVKVEIICDCPCESPGHEDYVERDTANCHGSKSVCGVCNCNEDLTGRFCECKKNDILNAVNNSACISKDNKECSGHGTCVCGACKCKEMSKDQKYSGKFCECDNFSCKRQYNKLCSGHGTCECENCKCDPPYSGDDCSCNNELCINPKTKSICSGNGECKCGVCECNEGPMQYSGTHCETCRTCQGECASLSKCVECIAYKDAKCDTENCHSRVNVTLVDTLADDDSITGIHKCYQADDSGCTFVFIYQESASIGASVGLPYIVQAQKSKECGKPLNILAIVLGITGGTVIIGLLSLIGWKIVTDIHDRMEFTKFEKERAASTWGRGENPLYKPSTSTFSNPTFGQ